MKTYEPKNQIISVPARDFSFVVLTQGQVAIVDNDDLELIGLFRWCAQYEPDMLQFRAGTNIGNGKKRTHLYMHVLINNTPQEMETDHINRYELDNRRENLRTCTRSQNVCNSRKRKDNTSGYKGVNWDKRNQKWRAQIGINSKNVHLGLFSSRKEAARAYDRAAHKYHERFALTNEMMENYPHQKEAQHETE